MEVSIRLEALERAASALMERRHLGDALVAALAAVQAEPLRESARRLVVQTQIAQGNAAEAIHSYREYRSLLHHELGLQPSRLMDQLIQFPRLTSDGGTTKARLAADWENST